MKFIKERIMDSLKGRAHRSKSVISSLELSIVLCVFFDVEFSFLFIRRYSGNDQLEQILSVCSGAFNLGVKFFSDFFRFFLREKTELWVIFITFLSLKLDGFSHPKP